MGPSHGRGCTGPRRNTQHQVPASVPLAASVREAQQVKSPATPARRGSDLGLKSALPDPLPPRSARCRARRPPVWTQRGLPRLKKGEPIRDVHPQLLACGGHCGLRLQPCLCQGHPLFQKCPCHLGFLRPAPAFVLMPVGDPQVAQPECSCLLLGPRLPQPPARLNKQSCLWASGRQAH